MPDDVSRHPDPFDMDKLKLLARLMSRHDLSEINLRQGDLHLRLRRGTRPRGLAAEVALPPRAAEAAPPPPPTPAEQAPERPARHLVEIKSPAVGTFYAQREPSEPPFVTVGSRVQPDTVVCLIEAMKTFNEVVAGCNGAIAEVLVNNKDPVEYNTVLFLVDPTG